MGRRPSKAVHEVGNDKEHKRGAKFGTYACTPLSAKGENMLVLRIGEMG
jgi:hypothetical protein